MVWNNSSSLGSSLLARLSAERFQTGHYLRPYLLGLLSFCSVLENLTDYKEEQAGYSEDYESIYGDPYQHA